MAGNGKKPNGKKPNGNGRSNGNGKAARSSEKQTKGRIPHPSDTKPWLFKPGQSGNPKGRPRKPSLVEALTRQLKMADELTAAGVEVYDEDGNQLRPYNLDEIARHLLNLCMRGNMQATVMLGHLLERLDGKVPLKAEVDVNDGSQDRSEANQLISKLNSLTATLQTAPSSPEPN